MQADSNLSPTQKTQVTVVGAGFSGLSAAYELAKNGVKVTVLEAESQVGGLAAAFEVGGEKLDRFYHHWFVNDLDVMQLIDELGLKNRLRIIPTNTGVYVGKGFYKLSTPWDVLTFTPLSFLDRIRLGILVLKVRNTKDWMQLEGKTAHQWLLHVAGENVYRVVWQPLLIGKFGPYAEQISAVWFWNKLKLRGGSRGKGGEERLAYLNGGFVGLAESLVQKIVELGGRVEVNSPVSMIDTHDGIWRTTTVKRVINSDRVIVTTALPLVADMIQGWANNHYLKTLQRIQYIGNVCLVLELDRRLSKTYWLNVNDTSFPFVGVIEHTNFVTSETYGGKHIVYLSKYLPDTNPLYFLNADDLFEYAFPYLRRIFPMLERKWVHGYHLWRARWSQPIVEKYYSRLIPPEDGPEHGFHVCSMAQIYPEDRGTNYAIRQGRKLGTRIARLMEGN